MSVSRFACPNCGSSKTFIENQTFENVFESAQVVCYSCGMRGPIISGGKDALQKAVQGWNNLPRRN